MMKSDREFIDGIYAKAECKKHKKPTFFNVRKAAAFSMATAAVIMIGLFYTTTNSVRFQVADQAENLPDQVNLEQARGRSIAMEYYVEGNVTEVLKPYEGYGRIQVKLNTETSTLQQPETLTIAYSDTGATYQKGDYITATLIEQQIGTQDYYVIAD